MQRPLIALGVFALTLFASAGASAQSMNPALERLVIDDGCRTTGGTYVPGFGLPCRADHVAFKQLASQLAFALAPTSMHPARTLGIGGFELSLEGAYTTISNDSEYWKKGTRGARDADGTASTVGSPGSILSTYSVRARKGLGFGFEVAAQFGFLSSTSILFGGGDLRWSVFEGFRNGALRYIPDLAVGGGVRTTSGSPQIQMTIASLDAQLSKPIVIAENSVLTPWIGYQYNWVFANSGSIDLTPATDALSFCDYRGRAQPGGPTAGDKENDFPGSPVCAPNSAGVNEFENNTIFDQARLERQRIMFGAEYRYEFLIFGLQLITDLISPANAQAGSGSDNSATLRLPTNNRDSEGNRTDPKETEVKVSDKEALKNTSSQWTFALKAGVMF